MATFGVVTAAVGLGGQAFTVVEKITKAQSRLKGAGEALQRQSAQLELLKKTVQLVVDDESLQTANVATAVGQLAELVDKLQVIQDEAQAREGKSSARRFGHELFKGDTDADNLSSVLTSLSAAKTDLSLQIQMVNVGLTQDGNDNLAVLMPLVKETNAAVEEVLGIGRGLKIATQLQPEIHANGAVPLTAEDIKALDIKAENKQSWINNVAYNNSRIFQGDVGESSTGHFTNESSTQNWEGNGAFNGSTIFQGKVKGEAAKELMKGVWAK